MALSKARLKYLRSLRLKKYREQEKKFVLEGFRSIFEAVSSDAKIDVLLYTTDSVKSPEHRKLVEECRRRGIETVAISGRELDSFADTVTAQGIAALVHQRDYAMSELKVSNRKRQLLVALDGVSEPGNVGTIIRTSDWFGVAAVLLGEGTVELYNPKVVRSTMGSLFHLPVFADVNLPEVLGNLRGEGCVVIGASPNAKKSYDTVPVKEKTVVILGNEARGLSDEVIKQVNDTVAIRCIGKAESLNVGIACGILLAHFSRFEKAD